MIPANQTGKQNPHFGWRVSHQHQLALALLASLALIAIGSWYGLSAWQGEQSNIDQALKIPLEFRVDVNEAEMGELMAIPSVGPKMAEAIIGYRNDQGQFRSLEQLQEVSGIGPKKLEQMRNYFLPIE